MGKKTEKKLKKYFCEICDFVSRDKNDYRRHLSTRKHRDGNNGNKNGNTLDEFVCDICRKEYKFRSGLSRHKRKCLANTDETVEKKQKKTEEKLCYNNEDIMKLLKLTNDLLGEHQQSIHKLADKPTTINNKMTINMYLNDQCADAMSLKDFIDQVKVSVDDLLYTRQHGYVKGISNIFVKRLADLDPKDRPIHCSDKKRMQFYVKEEDKWEKDNKHQKIDRSIAAITHKQIKQIREWEKQHPNLLENDKLTGVWHEMCNRTMGGIEDAERYKNKMNIKKEVSSAVEVKDAMK